MSIIETDHEMQCGKCRDEQKLSLNLSIDRKNLVVQCDTCRDVLAVLEIAEGQFSHLPPGQSRLDEVISPQKH